MKNNSALPAVIMWAVCVLLAICIILSVLPVSDRDDLQQAGVNIPESEKTAGLAMQQVVAPQLPNNAESAQADDTANLENTPVQQTPDATKQPETADTQASVDGSDKPLKGIVIGLDPGHQAHSNKEKEPQAPGSDVMKKKVSSGTQGVKSRVEEHVVNLAVGLLLRDMLEDAGATVYITRTTADANISNAERAKFFNEHNVDLGVRLHCNGTEDSSVRGAFMLVPASKSYPYYEENIQAAKCILEAYGRETGLKIKKGITYRSDQTGFNWCERPVVNIEMGHMSNPDEDMLLTDAEFQKKMAKGICNGIINYFKGWE